MQLPISKLVPCAASLTWLPMLASLDPSGPSAAALPCTLQETSISYCPDHQNGQPQLRDGWDTCRLAQTQSGAMMTIQGATDRCRSHSPVTPEIHCAVDQQGAGQGQEGGPSWHRQGARPVECSACNTECTVVSQERHTVTSHAYWQAQHFTVEPQEPARWQERT
jgi:hypothetical protein